MHFLLFKNRYIIHVNKLINNSIICTLSLGVNYFSIDDYSKLHCVKLTHYHRYKSRNFIGVREKDSVILSTFSGGKMFTFILSNSCTYIAKL